MSHETLNVQQIRDFLDYIEAEATACVHEQRSEHEPHPDFVNALKEFMSKYGISLPVVTVPPDISPTGTRKIREGFLRDWRQHQHAMQSLRPLFDLLLAVAKGRPPEEQSRLHSEAFPSVRGAARD